MRRTIRLFSSSDIRAAGHSLGVDWWRDHLERRLPSAPGYASAIAGLRMIAHGGYPSTTGPLARYDREQLRDLVNHPLHQPRSWIKTLTGGTASHANAHVRKLLVREEAIGHRWVGVDVATNVHALACGTLGLVLELDRCLGWPAPTGGVASAIERHFGASGTKADAKAWERWCRNVLRPAVTSLELAGVRAQSPSAPANQTHGSAGTLTAERRHKLRAEVDRRRREQLGI